MPFGLKNVEATYQRAIVALLHNMIHHEMVLLVDDMIAKSITEENHMINLRKVFDLLRKYQLKLNPSKFVVGATSVKLLTLIVNEGGIDSSWVQT